MRASGKPDSAHAVWINRSPMATISSAMALRKLARFSSEMLRYVLNAEAAFWNASLASSTVASV